MKTFIFPIVFVLFLISNTPPNEPIEGPNVEGAWELTGHYMYEGNEVIDTVPSTYGYRQIKMYTKGKVMWTRYVPKDSTEWFGYGSYTTTDSTLVETLEYGSASMMKVIDTFRIFTFELQAGENHFSQINIDSEGNRTFSENYKRID